MSTSKFTYSLFYYDFFCMNFNSLDACIKHVKQAIKDDNKCKGNYSIYIGSMLIAQY